MFKEIFIWLSQLFYPNGRAFRVPEPTYQDDVLILEDGSGLYTGEDGVVLETDLSPLPIGGILYRLHEGIAAVQEQTWNDGLSILDSAIADNPNFTLDDAHAWYVRYGIYDSGTVPLAQMMQGINQKINYPGEVVYGRSHYLFIQQQLQDAGFNVYIYENRFADGMGGYVTMTPTDIIGSALGSAQHGAFQHGALQHGQVYTPSGTITKIVNYLEEAKDATFDIGSNYRSTFYISGSPITTFASVPLSRKIEFRQLLLQLKPAQTVGIAFINYT